jgi:hypothetical protein
MRGFTIPHHLYAASSLAQTVKLFGLERDTYRVEATMLINHFNRPLFAVEIENLWNIIGPRNKFTYQAINLVGHEFREYRATGICGIQRWDEFYKLMERYPGIGVRLLDPDENERHRPTLDSGWF